MSVLDLLHLLWKHVYFHYLSFLMSHHSPLSSQLPTLTFLIQNWLLRQYSQCCSVDLLFLACLGVSEHPGRLSVRLGLRRLSSMRGNQSLMLRWRRRYGGLPDCFPIRYVACDLVFFHSST